MMRQTVVAFTCPTDRLAVSIMAVAGPFEITSVSHHEVNHIVASVIVVVRGAPAELAKREVELKEIVAQIGRN